MKAGTKSLRFLGEGKELVIPFFQRRYIWKKDNWEELLDTFENRNVKPFLGSLILKEVSGREVRIIDGQQRLTTITILAKVIYDLLDDRYKTSDSGIRNYIENILFYRENSTDYFEDSKVRLRHSRNDKKDYDRVIKSNIMRDEPPIDLSNINDESSEILQCYKYFYNELRKKKDKDNSDQGLIDIFNSMFDIDNQIFVLIELEQNDVSEQTIFDTINRAGQKLNSAEIIKNNLFKKLFEVCDDSEKNQVEDIYDNNWENIFNIDKEEADLWYTERIFGNVQHTNLEFLLYCVAVIKWGASTDLVEDLPKVMFTDLPRIFDKGTKSYNFIQLRTLIEEIKDYAIIFKKYILDLKINLELEDQDLYFKYNDNINRLLLILEKFGIQMFYPYVIKELKRANQNEQDQQLIRNFAVLESFVMRRKISPKGTHDYTSKCYQIIKEGIDSLIRSDLANPDAAITDLDVRDYLNKTQNDPAKMILFWIELYNRRSPMYDACSLEYKFTLEHIMPKKWETNWKDVPIVDDGQILQYDSEEGKKIRDNAIQSIGNKTLLTGNLNSAVKNSNFSDKINGVSETKPGYRNYTSLLITKNIVENFDLDPVWDETHIKNRTNDIYNQFIVLWPTFSESIKSTDSNVISENTSSASDVFDINTDSDLSNYSQEDLDDPIKMINKQNYQSVSETEGMLTLKDFVRTVDVHEDTIRDLLREGKIIPDKEIKLTNRKTAIPYFKFESILNIAKKYGWKIIKDEDRKNILLRMVKHMQMQSSYKAVFLKAMFEKADQNGVVNINDVVIYFMNYYKHRINAGLVGEREDSVFNYKDCSYEDAENTIKQYPYKRFADMGIVEFVPSTQTIEFNSVVWSSLTADEKKQITNQCDNNIENYYKNL